VDANRNQREGARHGASRNALNTVNALDTDKRGMFLGRQPRRFKIATALRNTASIIAAVSFPVFVFWRLG